MSGEGELPTIGIGMLGYAFMGRAHAQAYRTLATFPAPPLRPELAVLAGRDLPRSATSRGASGSRASRPTGAI